MQMKASKLHLCFFSLICVWMSCKSGSKPDAAAPAEEAPAVTTPVTLTEPLTGSMADTVELNATSSFLLKTFVKSSATGYLQLVNAEIGRNVSRGEELFLVKTKEAQSLGNTITRLDSSFRFDGSIHIRSPGTGYISQLNYRSGDYVQDGEQLATITDTKSFVFMLALPYELRLLLPIGKRVLLRLPDGTALNGYVSRAMQTVDSVSQTQSFMIKVNSERQIPENLIAKVTLVKHAKSNTTSLLKSAVLTDETQSQFWIMKMIDSGTAVKVPVIKGLETSDKVEILSPVLHAGDKILLTGNYGLGDTAKVTIIK